MNEFANPGARIRLVLLGMAVVAGGMVVQLVRVQFGPYAPVFKDLGSSSAGRLERVIPDRGLIYDRNGKLLAANATMYYLEVELRQLTPESSQAIPKVISTLLSIDPENIQAQLDRDYASQGQLRIRLTRPESDGKTWPISLDEAKADVIRGFMVTGSGLDLSGLSLVAAPKRIYPSGSLLGHVLGIVNQEGKGFFGIEGFYDEWLAGKPITIERPLIPPEARLQPDPPAGVNLVLSIDVNIQQMVETALEKAIETSQAESGQVIVMDPHTGEVLAMAAYPTLDPTAYEPWLEKEQAKEAVISPAASGQYEPGSTFKVLVMAGALDSGVVQPDDVYIDTGEIEVGGNVIRNWDGNAWGPQTMTGCMEHSLNVCLAYVGSQKLGAGLLYGYLNAFGIGQLTGVDLAGEVQGSLRTPRNEDWTESDLGTNSFGQGVSVTPVQLLAAVGAVANRGVMIQPHLVREVVGPQGVYWPKPTILGKPIKSETAEVLTDMLAQSLDAETSNASVPGYRLAGKTGTAQVPGDFGYDPKWTIASFIGWGPIPNPQFIVYVRIDKPQNSPWGSVVAAPVFQDVVKRLVVMMNIPPDPVRMELAGGG
jgi:cell division protein FtsI/penicillin-binding protein 2